MYRASVIDRQPTSIHKAQFLHRWQTWIAEAITPTCWMGQLPSRTFVKLGVREREALRAARQGEAHLPFLLGGL